MSQNREIVYCTDCKYRLVGPLTTLDQCKHSDNIGIVRTPCGEEERQSFLIFANGNNSCKLYEKKQSVQSLWKRMKDFFAAGKNNANRTE